MSNKTFSAADYWDERLARRFDLTGVGHINFGPRYNEWIYKAKLARWRQATRGWPLDGAQVLDIGCGIGFWVAPYTERGARFTGVDISPTAVDKLRERFSQAEFIHADVSAPDCRPLGQYDVINIWDVLYHVVSDEGFANAAANIRQAARPGAKVLVSDWFTCGADRRVAEHVVYRPLATYERVWGPLGFELMDHLPLYRWLSRSDNRFPRVARRLGALHYALDSLQRRPGGILSLAVWRCV